VHGAADEIGDLRRLLTAARLPPPYVLVGHSYGGLLVRLFARAHPGATAGTVLVDSMGRDQDRRYLPLWRAQPAAVRRVMQDPRVRVVDGVDLRASEALAAQVRTLGSTPLAVITRGRLGDGLPPMPARTRRAMGRLWITMQDELATLSSDHVHVVAVRSGHFVQGADGQPSVVVQAVRAIVRSARDGGPLAPCLRVFTGAVRCRG
jgi:pimeloyl-ACP methyl ester carboxylesterase